MTTCPTPGCETTCDCDACLDAHLREVHGTTYGERFGPAPDAWISLCNRHGNVPVQRLEAVETDAGA